MIRRLVMGKETVFDIGNKIQEAKDFSLTPRQWWLYRLIKASSEIDLKLSVKDIIEQQEKERQENRLTFGDLYVFTDSEGNHSNCPQIYEDKDIINESEEIDKIICVKNNQFYLGTEYEEIEYHNKLMYKVCFYSHKAKIVRAKISKEGQAKLFTYDFVEMEHSKGRDYHEAFIRQQSLVDEIERLKEQLKLQKNATTMWKERYEYVRELYDSQTKNEKEKN